MQKNTPDLATDKLKDPQTFFLRSGSFLRKSSLDEIPQLINIIKGDMVFIGPRPALFNQVDLIKFRTKLGVHKLIPGITGWAQVNGRDNLTIEKKVNFDSFYYQNKSLLLDLKIILKTIIKVIKSGGVSH